MKSNSKFLLSAPIFAIMQLSFSSYSSLILSGYGAIQPFLNLSIISPLEKIVYSETLKIKVLNKPT